MKQFSTLSLAFFLLVGMSSSAIAQTKSKEGKRTAFNPSQSISTMAISDDYDFAVSTGTYSDLTSPASVNNGDIWDDPEYVVPIGFPFVFSGETLDSLYFNGLGAAVSQTYDSANPYILAPFETDLLDRGDLGGVTSLSPIGYVLEGSAGSRIFKLEWKNAGFYDEQDSLGTMNDSISLQMWLYEGSNVIEYHYGNHQVLDPIINYYGDPGAIVGLGDDDGIDLFLLEGNPASPTTANAFVTLNGTPANGTIYSFTPKAPSALNPDLFTPVKVYPNPSHDLIRVEWEGAAFAPANIKLFNGQGQEVLVQQGMGNHHVLDMSTLPNGLYIMLAESEGRFMRQSVVKQ